MTLDRWRSVGREAWAIAVSAVLLLGGLGVVGLARRFVDAPSDTVLISLALLPAVVYLVVSGRIGKLKGGGFEMEFARSPVTTVASARDIEIEQAETIDKSTLEALPRLMEQLKQKPAVRAGRTLVLAVKLGAGPYTEEAMREYVTRAREFRSFKFVVFVDKGGRVQGYVPEHTLSALLQSTVGPEFIDAINRGQQLEPFEPYGLVTKTVSTRQTNADALREMTNRGIEALVVVDDEGKLEGVVERDKVLSRMVLASMGE